MENRKRGVRKVFISLIVILLLVVTFFAGRYILYIQIRNTIESELRSLKEQEIEVGYDHLEVYPWSGKIEFIQLTVKIRKDKNGGHGLDAKVPYALIKGVDLIPFIRSKTLSIHTISVEQALITYSAGATLFEHDSLKKRKIELKNIAVEKVHFPKVDLFVRDTIGSDTLAHVLTDIHMNDLFLHKQLDSLIWKEGNIIISDFAMRMFAEDYGVSVKNIRLEISDRTLDIDTLVIKPVLDKEAFMAKAGKQSTYLDGLIPHIKLSGIEWFAYPNPSIEVKKMSSSFNLKLYRDKRLPFAGTFKPLPSHFLQRLNFLVSVDTLLVKDSFISYEEFPEEGDSTGIVYFDKLFATINTVHNNPKLKKDITMTAYSKFMGAGELNASFTFPYDTMKRYRAQGTLVKMPLVRLNRMLGSAAKAKIENGTMSNFKFNFTYNNEKSDGDVELIYDNLKVVTLRENKDNEQAISPIKTLLLNTFFIKKDVTEELTDDTRKGTIEFYRDKERSVFNFWWKSILSGIKSAYNLDKIPMLNDPKKGKKKKGKKLKEIWSDLF